MTNARKLALVGMGSNKAFGSLEPEELIRRGGKALEGLGEGVVLSPLYSSPAWPDPSQPAYVNAVAAVETALEPVEFLRRLQAIEAKFGRVRSEDPALRYAPRTLDLDFLALGVAVMQAEELILPHPRMAERDFVLLPLAEVAPGFVHPVTGENVEEMLAALPEVTAKPL